MSDEVAGGEAESKDLPELAGAPPPVEPPPPPAPPPPPTPPTPPARISPIGVALIAMSVAMVGYLSLSLVGAFINMALSTVLAQVAILASAVVVLRLSRRSVLRFTGLTGSRPRAYVLGAALGLGNALLFNGPIHTFSKSLFPEWLVKMFDMSELILRMDFTPLELGVFFAAVVIMAPIIEELLFRGVFFRALSTWNPGWAAVITAAVFSAYHLDPVGFLARFEIGLVLAWIFWRTKSLGACIAAHAANNLLAAVGAVIVRQGLSDPTEPRTPTDWIPMIAVGAILFVFAARALWRSEPDTLATPADDPEEPRRPFFAEVLPWATAIILSIGLTLRFDAAGSQLTLIDLTTPVRKAKTPEEEHEREVLKRLRRAAREGTGSVRTYLELRTDLSKREGR